MSTTLDWVKLVCFGEDICLDLMRLDDCHRDKNNEMNQSWRNSWFARIKYHVGVFIQLFASLSRVDKPPPELLVILDRICKGMNEGIAVFTTSFAAFDKVTQMGQIITDSMTGKGLTTENVSELERLADAVNESYPEFKIRIRRVK
jgi:hypothetical protein